MGFEALAPPVRSRLWKDADIDAAVAVVTEHGRVGWNEPYDTEGKARGAGSALARLIAERTGAAYRVSVFEREQDDEKGIQEGFYFSIKPKKGDDDNGVLADPTKATKAELIALAKANDVTVNESDNKSKIAKAINDAAAAAATNGEGATE